MANFVEVINSLDSQVLVNMDSVEYIEPALSDASLCVIHFRSGTILQVKAEFADFTELAAADVDDS